MNFTFYTPLSIEQCTQRLRQEVDDFTLSATKPFLGKIGESKMHIRYRNPHVSNSFPPHFYGAFQQNGGFGTKLIGSYKPHLIVRIFSTIWVSIALFAVSESVFSALERYYFSPSHTFELSMFDWFLPLIGVIFIILMRLSGKEDEVFINDFIRETISVSKIEKSTSYLPGKSFFISTSVIIVFVVLGAYVGYFLHGANGDEINSSETKVSNFYTTSEFAIDNNETIRPIKIFSESSTDIYACGYLTTSQSASVGIYWYKDSSRLPYDRTTHIKMKTGNFCVRLNSPTYKSGHYTVQIDQAGDILGKYSFDIVP
jgi:hypothetical protein